MLENIVCMEFIRRGYNVSVGKQNQMEIDFIAELRREKVYIQVSYLIASEEVEQREFNPLMEIKDNFPKYILSWMSLILGDKASNTGTFVTF